MKVLVKKNHTIISFYCFQKGSTFFKSNFSRSGETIPWKIFELKRTVYERMKYSADGSGTI